MADVFTDSGLRLRGDIKFVYRADSKSSVIDIPIDTIRGDVVSDPGLETAILIMLFTDRKADADDIAPDTSDIKRGWWGDSLLGFNIGSKLWLLGREKMLDTIPSKLEEYTNEGLQPLIALDIAKTVTSTARRTGTHIFATDVVITRSATQDVKFTYYYNWHAQIFGGSNAIY